MKHLRKVLATVLTLVIAVSAIPASSVKTDAATSTDNSSYIPPHVTSCDSGKYKFEHSMICNCDECKKIIDDYVESYKKNGYKTVQDMIDSASKRDEDEDYSEAWFFYSCPKGLTDDEVIEKFKNSIIKYCFRVYTREDFFDAINDKEDILPYIKNKHYFAEYIRKFGILQMNEKNHTNEFYYELGVVADVWFYSYTLNYRDEIEYAGLTNQQKIDKWWKDNGVNTWFFNEGFKLDGEKPLKIDKASFSNGTLVLNWSYEGRKEYKKLLSDKKHDGDYIGLSSHIPSMGFFITVSYDKNFKNSKEYYISLVDNKYMEYFKRSDLDINFWRGIFDCDQCGARWLKTNFSYKIDNLDGNKDIYYKICLGQNNWLNIHRTNYEKDCPFFVGTEAEGNKIRWKDDERPVNSYSRYVSTGVIYKDFSDLKKGNDLILIDKKSGKKIVTLKKPKVKSAKKKSKKSKNLTFEVKNAPKVKGYKTGYQIEVYSYVKTKCNSKFAKVLVKQGKKTKKVGKTYYYYPKKTYLNKNYNSTNKKIKRSGKSYKKVTLSSKKFKNKKNLRVRVRYYIKISGHTMYGKWSSVKKVAIK